MRCKRRIKAQTETVVVARSAILSTTSEHGLALILFHATYDRFEAADLRARRLERRGTRRQFRAACIEVNLTFSILEKAAQALRAAEASDGPATIH